MTNAVVSSSSPCWYVLDVLKTMSLDDYPAYVSENTTPEITVAKYFEKYMKNHSITAKMLIRDSLLVRSYVYQILSGKRQPRKDKLLALCIAARMSFEETQRALEIAQEGILYAKNPRDAAIIMHIHNEIYNLREINAFLDQNGFEIIK